MNKAEPLCDLLPHVGNIVIPQLRAIFLIVYLPLRACLTPAKRSVAAPINR